MQSITLNELQFEKVHREEVGQGYAHEIQVLLKKNLTEKKNRQFNMQSVERSKHGIKRKL